MVQKPDFWQLLASGSEMKMFTLFWTIFWIARYDIKIAGL